MITGRKLVCFALFLALSIPCRWSRFRPAHGRSAARTRDADYERRRSAQRHLLPEYRGKRQRTSEAGRPRRAAARLQEHAGRL